MAGVDKEFSRLEERFTGQVQVLCTQNGWPLPEREVMFAQEIKRRWRFDFAWRDIMLAVEIDGGTGRGGRHTTITGYREDSHKLNVAMVMGWRVLRGDSQMVTKGLLLHYVEDALSGRVTPSLRGPEPYMLEKLKALTPKRRRRKA